MEHVDLYTIGFTQKGAEKFFGLLRKAQTLRIIDVRLNNVSQLAGFAKRDDLKFFAKELCGMDYIHIPDLAPTKDILEAYKKHGENWKVYEDKFLELMDRRRIESAVSPKIIDRGCLLCSEHKPDLCHRRLVAEYLKRKWDVDVSIRHLY
jgi:uncharacterized protein (DUF488 family)